MVSGLGSRLSDDREHLRQTFDEAAAGYHTARPRYPEELFDAIARSVDVTTPHVLEIGPATGVATVPMARRGWRIDAIELGTSLAVAARSNTADLPGVKIVHDSFDSWSPDRWGRYDLVVAATAWHWLDPATRYERAHRHLRTGGTLAFWSATHVVPAGGDPFFAEIQDVYDEIGESRGDEPWIRPGQVPTSVEEIVGTELFDDVIVHQFDWEVTYDADGYLALLDTFSGHLTMNFAQRGRLYGEIRRRLAARPGGTLRRHWGAALHLARRR